MNAMYDSDPESSAREEHAHLERRRELDPAWTEHPPPPPAWVDRTSLATPFDSACLAALDDELLHHPVRSFADVCWAAAVAHDEGELDLYSEAQLELELELDADADAGSEAETLAEPHHGHAAPVADMPFADKLNTHTPGRRPVSEPLHVHSTPDFMLKTNPDFTLPDFTLPDFTLQTKSKSKPDAPVAFSARIADPSEAIGFFPTRPRRAPTSAPRRFFAYFHARPLRLSSRM
ncbi:hypothetical protein DFH09DRAFT_1180314 [Mycena vulgaris]|nr:hypothetical protein DFH09DRAFT_1180314 [Mycena vulgaris]